MYARVGKNFFPFDIMWDGSEPVGEIIRAEMSLLATQEGWNLQEVAPKIARAGLAVDLVADRAQPGDNIVLETISDGNTIPAQRPLSARVVRNGQTIAQRAVSASGQPIALTL